MFNADGSTNEKRTEADELMRDTFHKETHPQDPLRFYFHNQTYITPTAYIPWPIKPKFAPQRVQFESKEKNEATGNPYCTHRYLIRAIIKRKHVFVVANVHLGSYPRPLRPKYVPEIINRVIDDVNEYIRKNSITRALKVMIGDFNCDLETIRDKLMSSGKVRQLETVNNGTQSFDSSGTPGLVTTDGCIELA